MKVVSQIVSEVFAEGFFAYDQMNFVLAPVDVLFACVIRDKLEEERVADKNDLVVEVPEFSSERYRHVLTHTGFSNRHAVRGKPDTHGKAIDQ